MRIAKLRLADINKPCKNCQDNNINSSRTYLVIYYLLYIVLCFSNCAKQDLKMKPTMYRKKFYIFGKVGFEPTTNRVSKILNNLRVPGLEPGTRRV